MHCKNPNGKKNQKIFFRRSLQAIVYRSMKIQSILFISAFANAHKDFAAISNFVKTSTPVNASDDVKLQIYGLYKQATKGDCGKFVGKTFDVKDRLMHRAWCKNAGMSTDAAEDQYVALIESIVPKWRQ